MSALLILAISQLATPLPSINVPTGAVWIQEVDCRSEPADSSLPTERVIFRETLERKDVDKLTLTRTPTASWVAEMALPVGDKPKPWEMIEIRKTGTFPAIQPEAGDRFTNRLWRATRYSEYSNLKILGDLAAGIPDAEYRAEVVDVKDGLMRITSTFSEKPGLKAIGDWLMDEHGRIQKAAIVCENAFAPGGDGSRYTYRVKIKKL